jgi:uncharacterized membrane protein
VKAAILSTDLRLSQSPLLRNRRRIAALSLLAMAGLSAISLYQLGIVKSLPEVPLRIFDSERVVSSKAAYAHFNIPDGVLGMGSFAATLALASIGGPGRARSHPALSLAFAGKVAVDVIEAATHSVRQWADFKSLCSWCLVPAVSSFIAGALVIPEARDAMRQIKHVRNS